MTTMSKTDIDQLEGWLIKKTQKEGTSNKIFSAFTRSDNRRWFKVREVRSYDNVELALCYFKSNKDQDARGWIYLKDVTEIIDDGFMFTIVSNARTMNLEADGKAEHRLWLQSIVNLCPNANTSRIQSNIKFPVKPQLTGLNEKKNDNINTINLKDEAPITYNNNNKSYNDKEKKRDQYEENDEMKPKITGPKQSQVERFEKEDHRLAGNRFGKGTSMADRLHVHIKKDSNDVPYPEESKLEAPSSVQPITPLKFHSKSANSPDIEDIEVLNLDAIATKKLRLKNRRNRDNNRDNNDDSDDDDNSDDNDNNEHEIVRADEKNSRTPESIPVRRARDETNDNSMTKRTSIDDLLQVQGSLSFKDDPGSPILDLKAEKEMRSSYQSNNSSIAEAKSVTNTSKPPRPPNPKPPYAQKAKIQTNENNNNGIASTSSIVDKNFVNEDWDESYSDKTKQPKINMQGPGVQADPNWLDEDFDD